MDRDKRWARVEKAYRSLVQAEGERAGDALAAVEQSYAAGTNDEFVLPTVIGDYRGMQDGDGLFMGNFRADRAREILTDLTDPASDGCRRARRPYFARAPGLIEYQTVLQSSRTRTSPAANLEEPLR